MEEILASIRRILNEDDPAPAPDEATDEPPDDVLVLDRSMMVGTPDDQATDAPAAPYAPPAAAASPRLPPPVPVMEVPTSPPINSSVLSADPADLVAPAAAAAAASSLGSLARSLAAGRPTQVWAGGPTLEDIVRSELRPLLKDWLDSNLPQMVERLVRAEIDRVAGRPGS
jgi:cell pole-organizing protein PopZ